MKKTLLLFTFLSLSQINAQVSCASNKFYGAGSDGKVHSFTIGATTVTYNGPITNQIQYSTETPVGTLNGISISNLGGTNTLYSSALSAIILDTSYLMKYVSGAWQIIYTDNKYRQNSAGKGDYLYLQGRYAPYFGPNFVNRIERFDGTTPITLWADNSVPTTTADMAIDDAGNVYFFTGTDETMTDHLNIMSPDGVMLNSIPISFPTIDSYGCFISGTTLYIGFGPQNPTYPRKLVPVTFNSGNAIMGTPIAMPNITIGNGPNGPAYLTLNDLDSCAPAEKLVLADYQLENQVNVFVTNGHLGIFSKYDSKAYVYNTLGQKLINLKVIQNEEQYFDISGYAKGMYFVSFNIDGKTITKKFLKQ